jgi:hypothetical protein
MITPIRFHVWSVMRDLLRTALATLTVTSAAPYRGRHRISSRSDGPVQARQHDHRRRHAVAAGPVPWLRRHPPQ